MIIPRGGAILNEGCVHFMYSLSEGLKLGIHEDRISGPTPTPESAVLVKMKNRCNQSTIGNTYICF